MTIQETLDFIHRTIWMKSRPGLERITELMHLLGDPQKKLRFIHIAGTNGKGSTTAMLTSVLRQSGYRTGMYTSPHLWRVHERFCVNGEDISDEELCSVAEEVRPLADQMEDQPTEFEIITAMALVWFARKQCDVVVWEVGMGGRLDATNVIDVPEVAVIASISLDHTSVLGNTEALIAGETAGVRCLAAPFGVEGTAVQNHGKLILHRAAFQHRGGEFREIGVLIKELFGHKDPP